MGKICSECGYPLQGNETVCPECGCPITTEESTGAKPTINTTAMANETNLNVNSQFDWAQYFYECGVMGWEAFKKYFSFRGRASRREYWSLILIWCVTDLSLILIRLGSDDNILSTVTQTSSLVYVISFFPILGASIRRLHDIGKTGWWCICPIAPIFMYLKKSDEGENQYGKPNLAKNLL